MDSVMEGLTWSRMFSELCKVLLLSVCFYEFFLVVFWYRTPFRVSSMWIIVEIQYKLEYYLYDQKAGRYRVVSLMWILVYIQYKLEYSCTKVGHTTQNNVHVWYVASVIEKKPWIITWESTTVHKIQSIQVCTGSKQFNWIIHIKDTLPDFVMLFLS